MNDNGIIKVTRTQYHAMEKAYELAAETARTAEDTARKIHELVENYPLLPELPHFSLPEVGALFSIGSTYLPPRPTALPMGVNKPSSSMEGEYLPRFIGHQYSNAGIYTRYAEVLGSILARCEVAGDNSFETPEEV